MDKKPAKSFGFIWRRIEMRLFMRKLEAKVRHVHTIQHILWGSDITTSKIYDGWRDSTCPRMSDHHFMKSQDSGSSSKHVL